MLLPDVKHKQGTTEELYAATAQRAERHLPTYHALPYPASAAADVAKS
jgi:hypothetical protein